uniref:DNA-binding response regulator, AraC family n=1 Tax=uncultured bacterium contig00160 TaxID=1181593 RepID=A0A806KHE0_9BACT|nr:DNA-binding response regulator, AraC family [uncultured bacterium contig00160]
MSKLPNIIQRRELEPLLLKAGKIARYYEKAANCVVSVMNSNCDSGQNQLKSICKHCNNKQTADKEKNCLLLHMEAINEARQHGGPYIYVCPEGSVFWTCPFYSGERFAGAFVSSGIQGTVESNDRVKALANMMVICADQISSMSFAQKNISVQPENSDLSSETAENCESQTYQKPENTAFLIDMERLLLASLRRGDNIEAEKIIRKLLDIYYQEVKSNLYTFRLKAMELAVLLSRAASEPNNINNSEILAIYNRYLKKIEESANFDEITEILLNFTEKMSGLIFSFHGVRHYPALRKAERYIWMNYTRKLSLQEIAQVSGLSAPYFSTIFKEEMGENLSSYLNRLRVEKAAVMLVTTNTSINEIAKTCGFEDQSWFSKIFKNNTGFTPGKYRDQGSISGLSVQGR